MELVIASQNTHKVLEIREILKSLFPEAYIHSIYDFPNFRPLKEEGRSFAENAHAKAEYAAHELKIACIADDFGLVVPVIGGVEATLQKRYEKASPSSIVLQTKELLKSLEKYKDFERTAYLECAIAIATPQGVVRAATARCEGYIAENERGKCTFEFDTIFIKHDYNKTLAELPPSVKNRISYRRKACEKLIPVMQRLRR